MGKAGDVNVLGRKSKRALVQNKTPEEEVLFCLRGASDQSLVALDNRLLIIKPGMMAGATFGSNVTSLSYADIRGIEVHKRMVRTFLEVTSAGFESTQGAAMKIRQKTRIDPYKLPNCIPCSSTDLKLFKPYLDQLSEKITQAKTPQGPMPSTAHNQRSVVDELERLSNLRESGALTEEQFEQIKRKLLDD